MNGQTGKIAADLPVDFKKYLIGSLILAVPIFLLLNLFFTPTPMRMLVTAAALAIIGIILSNRQLDRIGWRELRMDDIGQSVANAGYSDQVYQELSRKKTPRLKTNSRIVLIMLLCYCSVGSLLIGAILRAGGMYFPSILILPVLCLAALFAIVLIKPKRVRKKEKKRPSVISPGRKIEACWKQLAGLAVILIVLFVRPVSDLFYYGAAVLSMLMTAWSFYTIVQEYNELTTRKIPQFGKRGGDRHE